PLPTASAVTALADLAATRTPPPGSRGIRRRRSTANPCACHVTHRPTGVDPGGVARWTPGACRLLQWSRPAPRTGEVQRQLRPGGGAGPPDALRLLPRREPGRGRLPGG